MQQSPTPQRRPHRVVSRYGKRFSLSLGVEQHDALLACADRYELSVCELIRRAIDHGLPIEAKRLKRGGGGIAK